MTNHHVLPSKAGAARSGVEFDYYERRHGRRGLTQIFSFDPEAFFLTDEALDFTVVALDLRQAPEGAVEDRPWIRLIPESGKALIGEPVNIIQHPGGRPQQIAIKNNTVSDRVESFLHYKTDTEPGSSGSPVFNMQWELAALHHAGVPERDDQNRILLRDGGVWNGRRSDVDRISWIANEGVRISAIVARIRELLPEEAVQAKAMFEEALNETPPPAGKTDFPSGSGADSLRRIPGLSPKMKWAELEDEALDRMEPEEVAEIKASLEDQTLEITEEAAKEGEALVAEGDSWFDYKIAGFDIIDFLKSRHGYRIHNVAEAGDTLDNMAWGTKYDGRWRRERPPLQETLDAVRRHRPRVVLLSGRGNDIAGDELLGLLNHKESGLGSAIRQPYADFLLQTYARAALEHIMDEVWKIDAGIHFVVHGYGYAIPDGRAVVRFLGLSFVGPWLRPALTAKGYTGKQERERIIRELINRFNDMLKELEESDRRRRIHYIDLRPEINRSDWGNELHLKSSAYRRVSDLFNAVIRSV